MTFNNLCSSCINIGCEFQSGIVRTECAFYMPPHIESDNCEKMRNPYPNNCKECYNRVFGRCFLWRQVSALGCNKHPNCPAEKEMDKNKAESENEDE